MPQPPTKETLNCSGVTFEELSWRPSLYDVSGLNCAGNICANESKRLQIKECGIISGLLNIIFEMLIETVIPFPRNQLSN